MSAKGSASCSSMVLCLGGGALAPWCCVGRWRQPWSASASHRAASAWSRSSGRPGCSGTSSGSCLVNFFWLRLPF
eukprot:1372373-Pyramimonas_sp.AAC.1